MAPDQDPEQDLKRLRDLAAQVLDICQREFLKPGSILIEDRITADRDMAQKIFALADIGLECAPPGDKATALAEATALLRSWHDGGALGWLDGPRVAAAFVHFCSKRH